MLQTATGAFGAVVISLDDHRHQRPAPVTPPQPAPAEKADRPCLSLLTLLDRYKMDALQRDHLDDDKMIRRGTSALWVHFEEHAGTAYGAYAYPKNAGRADRELVAMMLMREDNTLPKDVSDVLPGKVADQRHAVIGGALVAKGHEGKGLGTDMLDSCINDALRNGYDHLHARVRINNTASLHLFEKAGFRILPQTGPSPEDPDHTVHFLHLDLNQLREARKTIQQVTAPLYHFRAR